MKGRLDTEPYDLRLLQGQAAVTTPGTLFQLRNDENAPAEVLYIVSPSYLFENNGYDDARLVAPTWEELAVRNEDISQPMSYETRASREESMRRLSLLAGLTPRALADEAAVSLKAKCDYLAPDGSEIRLLVSGEHGGLAHCLLPAGKKSAVVRHRTVEELRYVLEGVGEIARCRDGEQAVINAVRAGDSLRIPAGTEFQVRAASGGNLKLLIATMPPWPDAKEAVAIEGKSLF